MEGWIGVDLDGTLAYYDEWRGEQHIGAPIPKMVERVQRWLSDGKEVRIFTARVAKKCSGDIVYSCIHDWCRQHIGQSLSITCQKDYGMIELWDDRAIRVQTNTGEVI